MSDKYANFAELSKIEAPEHYRIESEYRRSKLVIVAPHGGDIEPGTSEICRRIAGREFSWYSFEGIKTADNADLHITSTRFDEPRCLELLASTPLVLAVHGERSQTDTAFIGGLHLECIAGIQSNLEDAGFDVRKHSSPELQGKDPRNICNKGTLGRGVQLELARALRQSFFFGISRRDRVRATSRFYAFCDAIRDALEKASI